MEKYIKKVLDKYFANKMAEVIKENMIIYTYRTRITIKGRYFRFEIKNRKGRDDEYVTVFCRSIGDIARLYFEIPNKNEWIKELVKGVRDKLKDE